MVLLSAKKDISSSGIISSLNRSSSVAYELPHVWFGVLDADQGWVNQQAFAWQTSLEWGRKVGVVIFFPLGNQSMGMKIHFWGSRPYH